MRTDDEIIARVRERQRLDVFGWETDELIVRLPTDRALQIMEELYPNVKQSTPWVQYGRDRDTILDEMRKYMPFAWDKANNRRGISASRSMSHYMAWTWLAGDDFGDLLHLQYYGKPHLVRICEKYGWDHKQWDDGDRVNE